LISCDEMETGWKGIRGHAEMSSETPVFADQENRLSAPTNLVSNRRVNASNQK
jgi:hypothetical protein